MSLVFPTPIEFGSKIYYRLVRKNTISFINHLLKDCLVFSYSSITIKILTFVFFYIKELSLVYHNVGYL